MAISDSESSWKMSNLWTKSYIFLALGILIIFLGLRVFAWSNTSVVEDHDSVGYMFQMKRILTLGPQSFLDTGPDATPFYPMIGALFSLPGWSIETGARLASLVFSVLLFFAVFGIGKQFAKPLAVATGLLILSFSPALISLSFAVITEPSYIATIYLGLFLFWLHYKEPKLWQGAILGLIFGLGFLNRTEGILYLAIIPMLQGAHFLFGGQKQYKLKHFAGWSLIYLFCFLLLAAPQVWRVSNKTGQLAINGRQIWTLILKNPDGKSYEEKIYGLDYSPDQINLDYIQSRPEVIDQFVSTTNPKEYVEVIAKNYDEFIGIRLGTLIGPLGLIFFGFGLLSLYQARRYFEVFLIMAFIGVNLVGPFIHNVVLRHVAIIAPLMMLVAGVGIVFLAEQLSTLHKNKFVTAPVLSFTFVFILFGSFLPRFYVEVMRPSQFNTHFNHEYHPSTLAEPIDIIKEIANDELNHSATLVARKGYLAFFSGLGKSLPLPYVNYNGLVEYCTLNDVDLLFLEHNLIGGYPFLKEFSGDSPSEFHLLYRGTDLHGKKIELYRFQQPMDETQAAEIIQQEEIEK